jgi:hypothetical protein
VLIAIGALAYLGLSNLGAMTPAVCRLPAGLSCDRNDFKITGADNTIQLKYTNGMGDSINFTSAYIDTNNDQTFDAATDCGATGAAGDAALTNVTANDGASQTVVFVCPGDQVGNVGARFKGSFVGTYTLGSSTTTHTAVGEVSGPVE